MGINTQYPTKKKENSMTQENNAETLLKTDKAIFYHVWDKMKQQGQKSLDVYYDEETGEESSGDSCKYFGWVPETDSSARCALGFIMNSSVADEYDVEEKDATDDDVLATIISSNPEWKFTTSSARLVFLLQVIHDQYNVDQWNTAFSSYENFFSEDGAFTGFMEIPYQTVEADMAESEIFNTREIHVGNKSVVIERLPICKLREHITKSLENVDIDKSAYTVDIKEDIKEEEVVLV
jgi:hypothetical protein